MLQQYKILAFLALIVFSYTLGHYTGKHREIERQQQKHTAITAKELATGSVYNYPHNAQVPTTKSKTEITSEP